MLRMPNVLRAFEPRIESRSARSEMETHGQIDASAALARTGARRPIDRPTSNGRSLCLRQSLSTFRSAWSGSSPAHAAQRSGEHPGADKTSQPRRAWLGPPLQAGSRPKALPPTRWRVRRIWSHRFGKWRCCGWTTLPRCKLYGEFGLVNLVALIPSIATERRASS